MYQFFYPKNTFDRSPFLYQQANWLSGRLQEVYTTYLSHKRDIPVKVASNNLLVEIMSQVTVVFTGDLNEYVERVDGQVRRIAGAVGLSSAYTRGDIRRNVFYRGVNEVITLAKGYGDTIDLWNDWRGVSAVRVTAHPVTTLVIFDPLVENTPLLPTPEGYVQINVDLGLLMAQWVMFKASYPDGTMSSFISQVVAPSMMKSHLNIVLFNMTLESLGVIPSCVIRSNLPFAQPDLMTPARRLVDDIVKDLLNKSLTERQIINTLPVLLGDKTMLQTLLPSELLSMGQTNWVLHSQSVNKTNLVLEVCDRRGQFDRILPLLARIKRDNIQMVSEGWYMNGLSMTTQKYLTDRWVSLLARVPESTFESVDLTEIY